MNILLISQCTKNALTETRRILDQFAERRGDRTWQTPITMEGLHTLRKLLKKSARKNTAVACHWIRGRDHTELLWIVGDANQFNDEGAVPTNSTRRDILRSKDENDWHSAEDIKLLAALAALFHDLGKACDAFQQRLQAKGPIQRNLYRHEWISLRLFQAFVGKDDDATWLQRLASPNSYSLDDWLDQLQKDGLVANDPYPFRHLPPLASAIGWLVVTHHRLPIKPDIEGLSRHDLNDLPNNISAAWNEPHHKEAPSNIDPYWNFRNGLPVTTSSWQKQAAKFAQRLLQRLDREPRGWLYNPYLMHLARLCLMLADHHYSSLSEPTERVKGEPGYPLYANTDRKTGKYCQPLDEHLLGVAKISATVCHHLPTLAANLPSLTRHRGFRRRTTHAHFRWQDRAFELAESLRHRSQNQGFFGINMASTGCGKTLANGRILYALADPRQGARFTVALGLRTLTLQTGQAYRQRLRLGDDELAIRVGGSASRQLFKFYEQQAEASGSASRQNLIEEEAHLDYDGVYSSGNDDHPLLRIATHDPRIKGLIAAPILTCTVDHLIPATDGERGGRQIAPMLRLLTGDLVLDEIDDFDLKDMPALTRLVHWTGLLGSRVLLSSATMPPALAEGLYRAYRAGREEFQRNRGEPGQPLAICCAWFDEHDRKHNDCATTENFAHNHLDFARRRHQRLAADTIRRRAKLANLTTLTGPREALCQGLATDLIPLAAQLHQQHHTIDPRSGKRVSFGLIRMANIEPLVKVAQALYQQNAPKNVHIHLCVYHSQYPLLLRSAIERQLDQALNRESEMAVFELPEIRRQIDNNDAPDQWFMVLASPVSEVGRDHDYDWAIVEPSSQRSLIQLAGRVRRHRPGPCTSANIALLSTNLRALEHPGKPAFCRPGFEDEEWQLTSHDLSAVLDQQESEIIDARPRILPKETLRYRQNLTDLEHARLRVAMLADPNFQHHSSSRSRRRRGTAAPAAPLGAYSGYLQPRAMLTALLSRRFPFRPDTRQQIDLAMLPDEDELNYRLHWLHTKRGQDDIYVDDDNRLKREELPYNPTLSTWGATDYMVALRELADMLEMSMENCAKRFGTLSLNDNDNGWRFNPAWGFTQYR